MADTASVVTPNLEPGRAEIGREINVGRMERYASVVGGAALAVLGLRWLSLRALAMTVAGAGLIARGLTGHCGVYKSFGLNTAMRGAEGQRDEIAEAGTRVEKSIRINRPPSELYRAWRNFESLPQFMTNLESVKVTGEGTSHWVLKHPVPLRWDARIVNDRENELLAWESLEGSEIAHAGSVRFRPLRGGGTEVRVVMRYSTPAGSIAKSAAKLLGQDPGRQIAEDLGRFKQIMEAAGPVTRAG